MSYFMRTIQNPKHRKRSFRSLGAPRSSTATALGAPDGTQNARPSVRSNANAVQRQSESADSRCAALPSHVATRPSDRQIDSGLIEQSTAEQVLVSSSTQSFRVG
jgi:hypothetical protein